MTGYSSLSGLKITLNISSSELYNLENSSAPEESGAMQVINSLTLILPLAIKFKASSYSPF